MRATLGRYLAHLSSWAFADVVHVRLPVTASNVERPLYLTFDDGPSEQGTDELLGVLAEWNAPATFFLIGEHVAQWPEQAARIKSAGHLIGNHSFSHADLWQTNPFDQIREFARCQRRLEALTDERVEWIRPPFGKVTPRFVEWARRHKRQILLWDVMPPDFIADADTNLVEREMFNGLHPGSVICLHDNQNSRRVTPSVLRRVLPQLIDAGWQFELPPPAAALFPTASSAVA